MAIDRTEHEIVSAYVLSKDSSRDTKEILEFCLDIKNNAGDNVYYVAVELLLKNLNIPKRELYLLLGDKGFIIDELNPFPF